MTEGKRRNLGRLGHKPKLSWSLTILCPTIYYQAQYWDTDRKLWHSIELLYKPCPHYLSRLLPDLLYRFIYIYLMHPLSRSSLRCSTVMWAGLSLLLALCLLPGGGTESEGEGTRCKPPPGWSIGEVEPMKEVMGQVTVVALLQASWLFCLVQASL